MRTVFKNVQFGTFMCAEIGAALGQRNNVKSWEQFDLVSAKSEIQTESVSLLTWHDLFLGVQGGKFVYKRILDDPSAQIEIVRDKDNAFKVGLKFSDSFIGFENDKKTVVLKKHFQNWEKFEILLLGLPLVLEEKKEKTDFCMVVEQSVAFRSNTGTWLSNRDPLKIAQATGSIGEDEIFKMRVASEGSFCALMASSLKYITFEDSKILLKTHVHSKEKLLRIVQVIDCVGKIGIQTASGLYISAVPDWNKSTALKDSIGNSEMWEMIAIGPPAALFDRSFSTQDDQLPPEYEF